MSDIGYNRCPNDDFRAGTAVVGVNPDTGKSVELNINGVASVIAVQSAFLTVSAAMKNGHEKDFLEKIALCLFGKLTGDPHAICPLLTICSMCLLMLNEQAGVTFDKDGHVVIAPPDFPVETGPGCMFDDMDEGDDYGTDEKTVDGHGPGPNDSGGGTGKNGKNGDSEGGASGDGIGGDTNEGIGCDG